MKCEYADCDKRASYALKTRGEALCYYCKQHYEIVMNEVRAWKFGRVKKVKLLDKKKLRKALKLLKEAELK